MQQQLWDGLLFLCKEVAAWPQPPKFCCLNILRRQIACNQCLPVQSNEPLLFFYFTDETVPTPGHPQFRWTEDFNLQMLHSGDLQPESLRFLQSYLPYCFYSLEAKKRKRTISIAHFAQTLDGKIATQNGHSRWIGNEENLQHAHRMRALCDAILIGRSTLFHDQPSLTVRHVTGDNPRRVVLGNETADYSCLLEASADTVWVIGDHKKEDNGKIKYCDLHSENGRLHSDQILECLYQQGCYTVYIEGGTLTTSNFMADRALDTLQLHLSPQIFGSGKSAFVLPEIESVEEAIQFSRFHYQVVGDSLMFVGQLKKDC